MYPVVDHDNDNIEIHLGKDLFDRRKIRMTVNLLSKQGTPEKKQIQLKCG